MRAQQLEASLCQDILARSKRFLKILLLHAGQTKATMSNFGGIQ